MGRRSSIPATQGIPPPQVLKIRKAQLQAFIVSMNADFRDSLRKHVRKDLAEESEDISDIDLEKYIDQALERSQEYEVTTERGISLFLGLMILHGNQFDEEPRFLWIRKILANSDMDGAVKMDTIYGRLAVLDNRTSMPL